LFDIASLGSLVAFALGVLLLVSSVEKAVVPDGARHALISVGLRQVPARVAVLAAVVVEAAVGVGLLVAPSSLWTVVGIAGLGIGFAVLGLAARSAKATISCGCFGSLVDTQLGWHQLVFGPLFVGVGVWFLAGVEPLLPVASSNIAFGCTAAAAVVAGAIPGATRVVRAQRRSFEEARIYPITRGRSEAAAEYLAGQSRGR